MKLDQGLIEFMFENASDVIYRLQVSPTPKFDFVSPSISQVVGYTPEEYYSDPDLGFKIIHPDDRTLLEEVRQARSPGPFLLRCFHRNGSVVWTEVRTHAVRDGDGQLLAIEGMAKDVTLRQQSESSSSLSWLPAVRNLQSRLTDTLQVILTAQQFLANELDAPSATTREYLDWIEEGTRQIAEFAEAFVLLFRSDEKETEFPSTESSFVSPLGAGRSTVVPLQSPHLLDAKILLVDDSKTVLNVLSKIFRDAGYAHLLTESDPRNAVPQFLQFQPDLVLLDLIMPELDGIGVLQEMRSHIPEGDFLPVLVLSSDTTPEAREKALSLGAKDFLNKSLDHTETLLRVKNLLETRFLHLQLQNQNQLLEEKVKERTRELKAALIRLRQTQQQIIQQERLRALGQMASGIAHDFNNALVGILGFSELMLRAPENLKDQEKVIHYLELIHQSAEDATRTVKRMQEFYRPRQDDEPLQPLDLNRLVEQTLELTEPKWKTQVSARGVSLEVETDLQSIPAIHGNESDLREVLTNLIFNAVDAMPKGGTLTVRSRWSGESILLEIQDTGTGMSEDIRLRCLEPFFTTKGEEGSGLGLAMVYGIIHRHGGTIEIESEVGKGTLFRLRLPLYESVEEPRDAYAHPPVLTKLRFLIVDDEPMVREFIGGYLSSEGHTFETANNGQQALEVYEPGKFDLVVTDRAMPQMSGDELAIRIKALNPNQRILMTTGFGDLMGATGETPEGVDLILSKPIRLVEFQEAISKVMDRKDS
jgi:PAS domain S-box-containing protein